MVFYHDQLLGALIGLARSTEGNEGKVSDSANELMLTALSDSLTNASLERAALQHYLAQIDFEKKKLMPNCYHCASPCGRNNAYDMQELWNAKEEIRSVKSQILLCVKGLAAHTMQAVRFGYIVDPGYCSVLYRALYALGADWDQEALQAVVTELGDLYQQNLMKLADACALVEDPLPLPQE